LVSGWETTSEAFCMLALLCILCPALIIAKEATTRPRIRSEPMTLHARTSRAFGEVLEAVSAKGNVAAVTSADKAAGVLADRPGFWEVRKVL
jgi:hypothetical protein